MKKHNGMRPQDIVLLMAILALPPKNNKQLAKILQISESEVSESLYRSEYAGLIDSVKLKNINKLALSDFLFYGLKYVFPVRPKGIGRGIATAHSALPLKNRLIFDENYIWELENGDLRGQIIEPLYPKFPLIAQENEKLYELLSLIDAIRIGSGRMASIAKEELQKRLNGLW